MIDESIYVTKNHLHVDASQTINGFMSALDKIKLDNVVVGNEDSIIRTVSLSAN